MGSKAIVQKEIYMYNMGSKGRSMNDQRNLFYEGYNRVWYYIIGVSLREILGDRCHNRCYNSLDPRKSQRNVQL